MRATDCKIPLIRAGLSIFILQHFGAKLASIFTGKKKDEAVV